MNRSFIKKLIAVIAVLVLALSFTACGEKEIDPENYVTEEKYAELLDADWGSMSLKETEEFLDVKGEVDKKLSEQMGEGFTAAKFKGPEDGSYLIIRYGPDEDGNEKAGSISPACIFVDMTQ